MVWSTVKWLDSSIWPIDSDPNKYYQSGTGCNGNGASPSDAAQCHIQDTRWVGILSLGRVSVDVFTIPNWLSWAVVVAVVVVGFTGDLNNLAIIQVFLLILVIL